ncbi:MAG TPA: alanine racemase [Solirubrobacteraceae bacterium]
MTVRRAVARVNVAAIERNCVRLRGELNGGTELLCAVVKADGYGHGAVQSARAALAGGASWLAVAAASEAHELREAGVRDQRLRDARVLVMGALTDGELEQALAAGADVVVWSERQVQAVRSAGGGRVHVKLDSGMGRLGTRDPAQASRTVVAARDADGVELVGLMTHFATADDPNDDGFFAMQLGRFTEWAMAVKAEQPELIVHAANSAAMLREAGAQLDMVRCGIAVYGMDPFGDDPVARGLEPALGLGSYVAEVKRCEAQESAGYGRRFVAQRDTWLAVLPIGYGDGWRRGCSNNADVLIGGQRYPVVGAVSMDNITVDIGPDAGEELLGEEAILIGGTAADPALRAVCPDGRGTERITAEDVARRLGTINYEVTCALTPRVPRSYHRDGEPLSGEDMQNGSRIGGEMSAGRAGGGGSA